MSSAEAAVQYIDKGFTVVPVPHGEKNPGKTGWQELRITRDQVPQYFTNGQNIGLHCGEPSKWHVPADLDCPEANNLAGRFLKPTLTSGRESTPHSHWWFRSPETKHKTFRDIPAGEGDRGKVLMELLSTGHQALVSPSIHPEGERYQWSGSGLEIAEVKASVLREDCRKLATAVLIARHLPTGGRHDFALPLAGFMLRQVGEDVVLPILMGAWDEAGYVNEKAKREAHADLEGIVRSTAEKLRDGDKKVNGGGELERILPGLPHRIADYWDWKGSLKDEGDKPYMRTDLGNAERLVARHGHNIRYCFRWKCWLVYNGVRWVPDDGGAIRRLAKDTVRSIYAEAQEAADSDERKAIADHAIASEKEARVNSMIALARSEAEIAHTELDTDIYALNVENGTLDLRTGELRPHDPADYITKVAGTHYDPEAPAPMWERHMERVLPDKAVRDFVQRACGHSFSGDVSEDALFIPYGTGGNGKTVTYEALLAAAGDYGMSAAPDLLLSKDRTHPTEQADLFGARLVVSMEAEEGRKLAESLVKRLTGGDKIKARRMNEDFWQFPPTHKFHMSVNHKPEIRGTDEGIWRRVKLIPFTECIPEAEKDKKLDEKLLTELPGILAWAVRGCVEWYENGLREPKAVTEATNEYRSEMDTLAAFIEDRCVIAEGAIAPASRLYKQYEQWCLEAGEKASTQKMLGMRLRERGFVNAKITRGAHKDLKGWLGIGIRADDPDPDNPSEDDGGGGEPTGGPRQAPPSGSRADDRPLGENAVFAGNSSGCEQGSGRCGAKNPLESLVQPTRSDNVEKRSASSASSAPTSFSARAEDGAIPLEDLKLRERFADELKRKGSGARLNLAHYLRGDTTLEILTRSVLVGLGRKADCWETYAPAVEAAAKEPQRHPLDCGCVACV